MLSMRSASSLPTSTVIASGPNPARASSLVAVATASAVSRTAMRRFTVAIFCRGAAIAAPHPGWEWLAGGDGATASRTARACWRRVACRTSSKQSRPRTSPRLWETRGRLSWSQSDARAARVTSRYTASSTLTTPAGAPSGRYEALVGAQPLGVSGPAGPRSGSGLFCTLAPRAPVKLTRFVIGSTDRGAPARPREARRLPVMRPPLWRPPVAPSPAEQTVMRLVRRAKLFVWLRAHRHDLFDDD